MDGRDAYGPEGSKGAKVSASSQRVSQSPFYCATKHDHPYLIKKNAKCTPMVW